MLPDLSGGKGEAGLGAQLGMPPKCFHLYLGEICYRFNHRKQDLKTLLQKLLHKTTVTDIKTILVRLV
jgi:transposase